MIIRVTRGLEGAGGVVKGSRQTGGGGDAVHWQVLAGVTVESMNRDKVHRQVLAGVNVKPHSAAEEQGVPLKRRSGCPKSRECT